jgi:hypothetical protein
MDKDYSALARGDAAAIVTEPELANGTVAGFGKHVSDFRVDSCNVYMVVSAMKRADTIVSLRVRA